jgi:TolB-like protein/DNA-binding winged helix-turn-helix (wHTH) protein/Flp pilus assembly protein TadD
MKYSVSDLTIDTGTQFVSRDGVSIALPKLSYDLLLALVRAAPNLVSLDELMRLVWLGIVVSPETVSQRIKLLRDALEDDPREPRYIAGLRGRGYQMIAPVKELEADPAASAPNPSTASVEPLAPRPQPRRNRLLLIVVVVGFVLALGWFLANRIWSPKQIVQEKRATTTPALAAISDRSIAVLPFVDMSEKKDQEYFSDGLSEELIELLGKTPGLRVIARTSSFYFKGKAEKLDAIAAELHVANVLEGSVRKSGDRLRVTAQLIRADTSEYVWSQTFDRKLEDIFKIQDEIAGAVVTALRVHLLTVQQRSAKNELHTENLEAYDLYLKGKQSYNQAAAAGYQRAMTAFQAAIALDPNYGAAYADLALAQYWLADQTAQPGDVTGYDRALADAEKAIALDPRLAAGFSARGFVRAVYRFDFVGGQADLDKAVALNPGDAWVLHRSAILLGILGNLPEAIAREEQALALDPLSAEICMRLGFFLMADQQLARVRPLYEKALAIAPDFILPQAHLGELELLEGQPEPALATFRQTKVKDFSLTGQAKAEYSLGHRDASQRILEQLIAERPPSSASIASVYAWRGEKDKAFQWLERAYTERDAGITWLKIDFSFRDLRGDPRYKALLKKMNLPE